MENSAIKMEITFDGGKPLAALNDLIAKRVRFIRNESTNSAVAATAINVLKSVRAATKVADKSKAKSGYTIAERNDLVAGFKGKEQRRVVRIRNGHEITAVKTVNLAGAYQRGEQVKVYIGIIRYGEVNKNNIFKTAQIAHKRCYIIARTQDHAEQYLRNRVYRKITTFAGMAKWVIGQAMRQVSIQMNCKGDEAADAAVKAIAQKVGLKNLTVKCDKSGEFTGSASVYVLDALDYAMSALRGGEGAMNLILMKAANKSASVINHWVNHMGTNFWQGGEIAAPFPEIRTRR